MPRADEDRSGRTLGGAYLLEGLLGRGGMADVYRARHLATHTPWAIKIFHRHAITDAATYQRFQSDARAASALRHPHIAQVAGFGEEPDGLRYQILELLCGHDLSLLRRGAAPLDLRTTVRIARQAGLALQAAHDQGLVHRDIKPQHLFLVPRPDGAAADLKVLDFGAAHLRDGAGDHVIQGPPLYASPEALQGRCPLDGRADQFSLAVVLYQLLAGRLPFQGDSTPSTVLQIVRAPHPPLVGLAPSVPAHVSAALDRALAKEREDRFPTLRAFLAAVLGC